MNIIRFFVNNRIKKKRIACVYQYSRTSQYWKSRKKG